LPNFVVCPPHAAAGILQDEPQFNHRQMPVHLPDKDEESDGYVRGLSFDDYRMCSIQTHLGGRGGRHQPTPLWTQSNAAVQRVLLAFMEGRVFSKKKCATFHGNERERFLAVIQRLKKQTASLTVIIGRLCNEFVVTTDPARRKILQTQIQNIDRRLILASRPDVFYEIVVGYYRQRLSSPELAGQLGGVVSPWGIRALLHRMNVYAKRLGYAVEVHEPPPRQLYPSEQARKNARSERRAARDAERAAKRNARFLAKVARDAERLEKKRAAQAAKPKRILLGPTRERWKKEGKCTSCGGDRDRADRLFCEACRAQAKIYVAARRKAATACG